MSREPLLGDLIVAVAGGLTDAREELNQLDGVAGDGDLGVTAGRAADALVELAPTLDGLDATDAAKAIGMALARRVPSTGGTLIAFALLAAARVDAGDGEPVVDLVGRMLEAARDEIAARGKVRPGDRTMLDAVGPAAAAFRATADRGASVASCLAAAADAAEAGATSTVHMEATTGRAGWLADRARGHEDAGARLIAVIFRAAAGPEASAGGEG